MHQQASAPILKSTITRLSASPTDKETLTFSDVTYFVENFRMLITLNANRNMCIYCIESFGVFAK